MQKIACFISIYLNKPGKSIVMKNLETNSEEIFTPFHVMNGQEATFID